jgi:DNA-binding MarR family transcriptional regulator
VRREREHVAGLPEELRRAGEGRSVYIDINMSHASPAVRSDPHGDVDAIVGGLRRIVKALHAYSEDVQREFGLTGPQLWALKTLLALGPIPVGALARELAVQPSSASLLASRLVERRLVRRVRAADDGRVVHLTLTLGGRRLAGRAPEAAQGRLLHGLRELDPRALRKARRAIDGLVRLMELENLDARFFFADD